MKKAKFLLLWLLISLSFQSCFLDKDDLSNPINEINAGEVIEKHSELYNLLLRMTNSVDDPFVDIVCIRFNYSFLIYTYDESLEITGETWVTNDSQFYSLLENLSENQSISLSYPIETTLADGTPYLISTNEELMEAIKYCAQEETLAYCYLLFQTHQCVWKVPYIEGADNTYASGVFTVNSNTSVSFDFQNNTYTGTWIFLYVNDVLNFNINLAGNSQVAQDWNINFNVDMVDNIILLTSDTNNYLIKQTCNYPEDLEVGQETEMGRIVAYDKGIYEKGWRYIETYPTDLPTEEWGCLSEDIPIADFENIGDGLINSAAITNRHLELNDYLNNPAVCNPDNNGTVSALSALLLDQNPSNNNLDWFLPSIEELLLLYENLHLEGLGNFLNDIYWSSTQADESHALGIDFSTGNIIEIPKNSPDIRARAVRYL